MTNKKTGQNDGLGLGDFWVGLGRVPNFPTVEIGLTTDDGVTIFSYEEGQCVET